jgi:cholesterol transport system auxiliary component
MTSGAKSGAKFAVLMLLAGCGGNAADPTPRAFDLGIAAPAAKFPSLRVASRAVAPFDTPQMYYRLAWRNPAELADYSHSQWAAQPAELLRKQVLRSAGEGIAKCTLEIEVQEFTQVFTSKEASEARIEARVVLATGTARIASRGLTAVETGAGGEAAAGAAAMARAADRALTELAAWVSAQAACR